MLTTLRAAIAVAMLFGFYLYAFALAGVLLIGTLVASDMLGVVLGQLVLVTLALPLGVLVATWRVIRAKAPPAPGVEVTLEGAPAIWDEVRSVAQAVGTRVPDEIRLVADVNAAVFERTRLLGLIGGRRYLYVGVPLVQCLTVGQLRAVLAHELGHYSHSHTRLGELTYRGGDAIAETIKQVGPTSFTGWMLRAYHGIYFLVSLAVNRRQELEADRAAVRVAGRRAAAAALRELPALDAAWAAYWEYYVEPGLDGGLAPANVLRHFPRLVREREAELAPLRESPPTEKSLWDSHPPIAERIRLLEAVPDAPVEADDRPATVLVPQPDRMVQAVEEASLNFGDRMRMPMEEYTARALQYLAQHMADGIFRAAARMTGGQGGLPAVLDVVASGRQLELVRRVDPGLPPDEGPEFLQRAMVMLLELAAVRSGVADWSHSWSEPAELRRPDGQPLDLTPLAAQAIDAKTLPNARIRLRKLGIDPEAATLVTDRVSIVGSTPLAGLVGVVVDGARSDVVILDTGLLVVPGLPRLKASKSTPRMRDLIESASVDDTAIPGSRFIPVEEIVEVRRRVRPRRYVLRLQEGESVKLRWGVESAEVGSGWSSLDSVLEGAPSEAEPHDGPAPSQPSPT